MQQNKFVIEIATSDFSTTQSAINGGADRIELCANLTEGGTTPSFGLIAQCRKKFSLPIYVMIRPRGGDFLYTNDEFEIMMNDVNYCKTIGCDGVVLGMLLDNGEVDVTRTKKLVENAYPMGVTFHRAFDFTSNIYQALENIISCGCERILTSGQATEASLGVLTIYQLNEAAKNRICIMPGKGIKPHNILEIAMQTGCFELHSSLRNTVASAMKFKPQTLHNVNEMFMNNAIYEKEVKALKLALKNFKTP